MGRRPPSSILPVALLLASAGCEATLDPIAVPDDCPDMPLRGPTAAAADVPFERLIDDFDDGDTALIEVADRNGYWKTLDDKSSTMIIGEASGSCAARGPRAGHFVAKGFHTRGASWSGYFAATMPNNSGAPLPYDGSGYGGISFWAAIGGEYRAPFPVRLGVQTTDTTSTFQYFGTTVELTHSWQRFVLPFSALVQMGPASMDGSPRIDMRPDVLWNFIIWPDQGDFNIWLDDLRFEPE